MPSADGGLAARFSLGLAMGGDEACRLKPGNHLSTILAEPKGFSDLPLPPAEAEVLQRLQAKLLVPVRFKGGTTAVFVLGGKLSGEPYDRGDCEFAAAFGEHSATALDRIRLRQFEWDAERAWQIQRRLLPAELPVVPSLEIAASCQPARAVGGDYYDAFKLGDRTVVLCIGDVVGKGMPAALLMANLQAAVKALSSETVAPRALCEGVNRLIARNIKPGEFITFFYALIDIETGRIVYTNAGHNPPLLFRRGADIIRLDQGGPVLGVFPEYAYLQGELPLEAGDRLLMFTDGVTEATNSQGDEFGEDRLISVARLLPDATTLHHAVIEAVTTYCGGDFHDDVTVVAVSCEPTKLSDG